MHFNDGRDDLLNLIVEVLRQPRPEEAGRKTATARDLWLPGVNNDGRFGRWDFIEISDPWDAQNTIRAHVSNDGLLRKSGFQGLHQFAPE